jgi:hypothetical protein
MKIKATLIAAATLAVGVISSQAQVYSQNIVGYINTPVLPNGQFVFIQNPLQGATNDLADLFPGVPTNTKVWEFVSGNWTAYTKRANGTFSGYNGHQIYPGEGLFVQSATTDTVGFTNTFTGTVITGTNVLSYLTGGGFTPLANLAPVSGRIQTDLGFPAVNGDKIWTFDPTLGWQTATRRTSSWSGAWFSGTNGVAGSGEPVIRVGQAFFVQGSGATTSGSWTNVFVPQ